MKAALVSDKMFWFGLFVFSNKKTKIAANLSVRQYDRAEQVFTGLFYDTTTHTLSMILNSNVNVYKKHANCMKTKLETLPSVV